MPDRTDYQILLDTFGEKKILNRFKYIFGSAEELLQRYEKDENELSEYFAISEYLIEEIVLDYFSDIKRLHDFHHIEKAEPEKVASYTSYWIWRRKPIQIIKDFSNEFIQKYPYLKWINETFAASVLISMLYDTAKPIVSDEGWSGYNKFSELLSYYFSYRAVNPQSLELTLYALSVNPIYEKIC